MLDCDFIVTPVAGRYQHECRQCGRLLTTDKPLVHASCRKQLGVGTELKLLLGKFGLVSKGGCKCDQRALFMNESGPDWCRENISIIVDWLQEEAEERGLPFVRLAANILVRKAIRNARKKQEILQK